MFSCHWLAAEHLRDGFEKRLILRLLRRLLWGALVLSGCAFEAIPGLCADEPEPDTVDDCITAVENAGHCHNGKPQEGDTCTCYYHAYPCGKTERSFTIEFSGGEWVY